MAGMREIEFEFDEGGAGEFRPSGNVVKVISDYLARDDTEKAASLLAASSAEIGDQLIEEAEIGASNALWTRLANLFSKAKDVGRAAKCAQAIGDWNMAAGFYEAAYEWSTAAEAYRKSGNLKKAASMHERALAFDKAALLYYEAGEHLPAAECYAKAGAYYHAGHLYMKMGRYKQAVEVLQRVERMQKYFVESSALLGKFFDKAGDQQSAISKYADVVKSRPPIDEVALEVHHRLATLLIDSGRPDQAKMLWERVLGHSPEHAGALNGIKTLPALPAAGQQTAPVKTAPAVSQKPALPPTPVVIPAAAGGVAPLVLPGDDVPVVTQEIPGEQMVAVHENFDVLRTLPIFGDLSLDELRGFHMLSERVVFEPGKLMIEQDQEGKALYVIASGTVKVEVLNQGKPPVEVARLGQGASLGEMSMVDSAPASARVTAVDKVTAFSFPLNRLSEHIIADPRAGVKVMKVLGRILSTRLREANRALSS